MNNNNNTANTIHINNKLIYNNINNKDNTNNNII